MKVRRQRRGCPSGSRRGSWVPSGAVGNGDGFRSRWRRHTPGAVIPMLPIEHIAPMVAALLGLDLPDVDGTLLPGVLSNAVEDRLSGRP